MARKRYKPEEIVSLLRQEEFLHGRAGTSQAWTPEVDRRRLESKIGLLGRPQRRGAKRGPEIQKRAEALRDVVAWRRAHRRSLGNQSRVWRPEAPDSSLI